MKGSREQGARGSWALGRPEDVLQRLVCFIASALDAPYAFVTALSAGQAGEAMAGVTVWLARDYGLCFERRTLVDAGALLDEPWPYPEVLRRLWPDEPELSALAQACGPGLPLIDSGGRLLGHLAALSRGSARHISEVDRLRPLANIAVVQLERRRASTTE